MKIIWLADAQSTHIRRWAELLKNRGIQIKIYSMPKRRPRFLYIIDVVIIWFKIRNDAPNLVHAHFVSSYGVVLSFLPIASAKVVSIWGSDVLVAPNKNILFRFVIRRALKRIDVKIANSQYLTGKVLSLAGARCETLAFGINLAKYPFCSQRYDNLPRETFNIGIVKRLHRVAGVDVLLKAFSKVIEEMPNARFKLVIAGKGPEEQHLKLLASKLGINEHVSWRGWCDTSEIVKIYSEMHLAVFPSRVEGLGVSVIEAMACGVPVIGTCEGGIRELIGNNCERGEFFTLSSHSLAAQIKKSMKNRKIAYSKTLSAREFVSSKFDIFENVDQLLEIYSDALNFQNSTSKIDC